MLRVASSWRTGWSLLPNRFVALTGTNGKTTTARMLAHVAKMAGYTPGLTTTDGVYLQNRLVMEGDMTGPFSDRASVRVHGLGTCSGGC